MAELFTVAVCILILGFLWFWVVRPILIDFRVLKVSREVSVPSVELPVQTDQTKKQTDLVLSEADRWLDRLEVDRTKAAVLELLVYSGWTVGEVRAVLKGDNAAFGGEVAAARQRLGMGDDPPRMLKVREGANERVIPA